MEVPVEEVQIDDLLLVRPGESIRLDGIVQEGYSSVDQSMITGERHPRREKAEMKSSADAHKTGAFKLKPRVLARIPPCPN